MELKGKIARFSRYPVESRMNCCLVSNPLNNKKNVKVLPLRHEGTKKRNMKAGSNPVRRETENTELFIDGIDMWVKHKIYNEASPQTDEPMRNRTWLSFAHNLSRASLREPQSLTTRSSDWNRHSLKFHISVLTGKVMGASWSKVRF